MQPQRPNAIGISPAANAARSGELRLSRQMSLILRLCREAGLPEGTPGAKPMQPCVTRRAAFLHYRASRADDRHRVLGFWRRHGHVAMPGGPDSPTHPERSCGFRPQLSILAELGGCLVGTACCSDDGCTGWIRDLVVAPVDRSDEIETELVRRCLVYLAVLNIPTCDLLSARRRGLLKRSSSGAWSPDLLPEGMGIHAAAASA
jgi:hypothetical protein